MLSRRGGLESRLLRTPVWGPLTRQLVVACLGVLGLGLVGAGLHSIQSQDLRRIVIADGAAHHLAVGRLIEGAFESAAGDEDPWRGVREVLTHVSAESGAIQALVLSSSGRAVAAGATDDERAQDRGPAVARVLRTGLPGFEATASAGGEVFEHLSRIELAGEPYVFAVEFEPVLLADEIAALDLSAYRAIGLGAILGFPLLYLLGGWALARRAGRAGDQALVDSLTGLGNRRSFEESLPQEIARSQRYREPFTLVLVDVDDFKRVNDSQGHQEGDAILVGLAAALGTWRTVDRAFRIGGDEFAVILPHTRLAGAATAVGRLRAAARPVMSGTTVSVGLAEFNPDSLDTDTSTDAAVLRQRADLALFEAKRRGPGQVATFAEIVASGPLDASAATIAAVRDLLTTRRMGAAFQSIWNLDTYRVFGYEGLARPAEEYGLAGPREAFLGAARLGRVDELDKLCREAVLAKAGDLPDDVLLFLNISPEVFDHGGGTGQRLRTEVEAAGLRPERVVIEVTESARERMDLVIAQIHELRDQGFQLALDRAGSGDSGLGLLGRVRPDYVKVDPGVIHSARDGGPGRAVLAAIVAFAAESGAIVIAEGIETGEMLHLVREARTVTQRARFVGGQGYLLGRPDADAPWRHDPNGAWPVPGMGSESPHVPTP